MTWIFGYGSLIWRPDFPHDTSRKAVIHGWRRRFWQASPDHRGVPGAPGRVVTLVEDAGAHCWGRAFLLPEADQAKIIADLDHREKNGYAQVAVDIEFDDLHTERGFTYVAGPSNPSFVGAAPLDEIVSQIATATGASGSNVEYLLCLAKALDELGVYDEEVHGLRQALEATTAD